MKALFCPAFLALIVFSQLGCENKAQRDSLNGDTRGQRHDSAPSPQQETQASDNRETVSADHHQSRESESQPREQIDTVEEDRPTDNIYATEDQDIGAAYSLHFFVRDYYPTTHSVYLELWILTPSGGVFPYTDTLGEGELFSSDSPWPTNDNLSIAFPQIVVQELVAQTGRAGHTVQSLKIRDVTRENTYVLTTEALQNDSERKGLIAEYLEFLGSGG